MEPESASALRFDRAEYAAGSGVGASCSRCSKPLSGSYWKWQQHLVCASCRDAVTAALAETQSPRRLAKALLLGGATAVGCGIAYAIFVGVTKIQLALVTIGIAFLVARVVRRASGGIGGRRYQIIAVALTYLASTMGYLPAVFRGLKDAASHTSSESPAAAPGPGVAGEPPPASKKGGALELVAALGVLLGIVLAAPFLELTTAPIGALIVVFGLWEAWRLSRGPPLVLDGPYSVAAPAAQPPSG